MTESYESVVALRAIAYSEIYNTVAKTISGLIKWSTVIRPLPE